MAAFARPIRRGDFVYSSVLYADLGNDNHHPRASIADIAALLRPEGPNLYTKPSKPTPATSSKDPPWHWYAAQLIHYGLPVTKDKNTAKVRLLNAMNQFKLELPAWILKTEGENKKAKRQVNGSAAKPKPKPKAKKENTGVTGIGLAQMPSGSFNFNGIFRCGAASCYVMLMVLMNVSMSSGMVVPVQAGMAPTGGTSQKKKRKHDDDEYLIGKSVPKKVAGRKSVVGSSTKTKNASPPWETNKYSTPQVARKPTKSLRTKRENPMSSPYASSVKSEGSFSEPVRSRNGYVKQEEQPQPIFIFSGEYAVGNINIEAEAHIDVYKDTNRGVWWANAILNMDYDDDEHQFVIKMDPGPDACHLGEVVTLGWRMRSMYTEEVKFGSGCTGKAIFFEDGGLTMNLHNVPGFGDVEMSGYRMHGPSRPGDLQQDWDHFRRIAYGR